MSDYPKKPSTCELLNGTEGQPGAVVKCAHCGEPFVTTAWNWNRRNFIRRKCQDVIRAEKAAAGQPVKRTFKAEQTETFPPGGAPADAARTIAIIGTPDPVHQAIRRLAQMPPEVMIAKGAEVIGERDDLPPVVNMTACRVPDKPETRRALLQLGSAAASARAGEPLELTFRSVRTPARTGRDCAQCPVCGDRAEASQAKWDGEPTLFIHRAKWWPGYREVKERTQMYDFCLVYADGVTERVIGGRKQHGDNH